MELALYDITGIQSFIFSTTKAKENIGASLMVQKILDKKLIEVLESDFKGKIFTNWEENLELRIIDDDSILGEVIYVGGGNSIILYRTDEIAKEVTRKLSLEMLYYTKGEVGIVVDYLETELNDFNLDLKKLYRNISKKKDMFTLTSPLKGLGITYEARDGLTKSKRNLNDKKDINSDIAKKKDNEAEKDAYNKKFDLPKDFEFPKEFDNLGQVEGDNYIAVVHIDGNSMGDFIEGQMSDFVDYIEAVPAIRSISKEIRDAYQSIFKELTEVVIMNYDKLIHSSKIKECKNDKNIKYLPLRPIILNGDDVTFVCNGMLAIQLVELFLEKLSKKTIRGKSISACAGIAIIKSHYPFARGYKMAETLCSTAKQKAKAIDADNPGSWFDYHIVYAGFNDDLESVRESNYNVSTMNNSFSEDYPAYNLLIRPFKVNCNDSKVYNWFSYKSALLQVLTSNEKIPRSRLKGLRNSFQNSEETVQQYHRINLSRGYKLPNFANYSNEKLFSNNQTPYYEILELMDFYLPEIDLLEVKDEN